VTDLPERERLVGLEGALNCRDLGGYPAADGRTTRWGRVFRSDGLDQLTDADLDVMAALGLKLVCDFRMEYEVELAPSRLPDDPALRRIALPMGDAGENRSFLELLQAGEITELTVDNVVELYAEMLVAGAHQLGTVIAQAADPANHPMLFHCTAGKDRTGLASMLLLGALGVGDDVLVHDYELTTEYRSNKRLTVLRPQLEAAGVDVDAVLPFLTAQGPVMAATITALRVQYGSIEGYLTNMAGMEPLQLEQLRGALLD
jgi:protein-tyrosine phosphatase